MGNPLRRRPAASSAARSYTAERDEFRSQLLERLHSLDENCLDSAVKGLHAAVAGDYTVVAVPVTKPIDAVTEDPVLQEIGRVFNSMLAKAQAALEGYNVLREQLAEALGDQSCLGPLTERLHSLSDHCLANLGDGLQAAASGDLTVEAIPVTTSVEAKPGSRLGELGEVFNTMLGQAQGGLQSYNSMRGELAAQHIASTSEELATMARDLEGLVGKFTLV